MNRLVAIFSGTAIAIATGAFVHTADAQVSADPVAEAVELLQQGDLNEGSPQRAAALRQLAQASDIETIEAASEIILDSATADEQLAWLDRLLAQEQPAPTWVPTLRRLLLNPPRADEATTPVIRRKSAKALAAMDQPAADEILAEAAAAGRVVPVQLAAVEGLSQAPRRVSLDVLGSMLSDAYLPDVRDAAARALARLVGPAGPDATDVVGWRRWSETLRTDNAFAASVEAQVQRRIARSAAELRSRLDTTEQALGRHVRGLYQATAVADRPALLGELLVDASAASRLVAGRIVQENLSFGDLPSDQVSARARDLIDDSDPRLRKLAAQIVRDRSDAIGSRRIAARMPIEADADVRLAMLRTLSDLATADDLGMLLQLSASDPSPVVRNESLRVVALLATNADEAVVRRLSNRLRERLSEPANELEPDERAALLEALSALPDRRLGTFWVEQLLELTQADLEGELAERNIVVMLNGLRTAGDPRTAELPVPYLRHPNSDVRVAAVKAVATLGGFTQLVLRKALFDVSPEEAKRDPAKMAAREAFIRLLPEVDARTLVLWPDRLSDATLRLAVLDELVRRAKEAKDVTRLADRLHQRAETLLEGLERPADAAASFEEALLLELDRQELAAKQANPATRIEPSALEETSSAKTRVERAIRSYLLAGRMDEAGRLTGVVATRRPRLLRGVGAEVRKTADKLIAMGRADEARGIVRSALAWQPGLDQFSRKLLADFLPRIP